MINSAAVFTKGGLVLWYKNVSGTPFDPAPFNRLICESILCSKGNIGAAFKHGIYDMKWLPENDLNLIFVIMYLNISHLVRVDEFLAGFKDTFCALYGGVVRGHTISNTLILPPSTTPIPAFTPHFSALEKSLLGPQHKRPAKPITDPPPPEPDRPQKHPPVRNPTSAPTPPTTATAPATPAQPPKTDRHPSPAQKPNRVWTTASRLSAKGKKALDFSKEKDRPPLTAVLDPFENNAADPSAENNAADLSDDDDDPRAALSGRLAPPDPRSSFFAVFQALSSKTLSQTSLSQPLARLETLLVDKNVAAEVARAVCAAALADLDGKSVSKAASAATLARETVFSALCRVVTPARPFRLLRDIAAKTAEKPFSIAFVGVNGVGKSTSLAKVAFYLKKRGFAVSIAACDTFRGGAVEQVLTHARALGVRAFHRGYARDAAQVCAEALKVAAKEGDDVVLIDTAGRMQNNEPLMRALAKLAETSRPDRVLFVGESLVGNEALAQLQKFGACVRVDGVVLTKFDTVGDKVGAAISMTYRSRLPIVFLGTGQGYEDLVRVKGDQLVAMLMR